MIPSFSTFYLLSESAPPDPEIESWIKEVKPHFKKQYVKDWKAPLYATAWKKYKEKGLHEGVWHDFPYGVMNSYGEANKAYIRRDDWDKLPIKECKNSHCKQKFKQEVENQDECRDCHAQKETGFYEPKNLKFLNYNNSGFSEEHIGFKKLQGKLETEGKSKESAGAIAAAIGRKKYGKKKMAKASKEHKPL